MDFSYVFDKLVNSILLNVFMWHSFSTLASDVFGAITAFWF